MQGRADFGNGALRRSIRTLAEAIGLDVAFQEWFYEPRTVSGNLNPPSTGHINAYVHLGIVSAKFLF